MSLHGPGRVMAAGITAPPPWPPAKFPSGFPRERRRRPRPPPRNTGYRIPRCVKIESPIAVQLMIIYIYASISAAGAGLPKPGPGPAPPKARALNSCWQVDAHPVQYIHRPLLSHCPRAVVQTAPWPLAGPTQQREQMKGEWECPAMGPRVAVSRHPAAF